MRTKRIDLIEEYILSEKSVSLDTLCEKFQVSKNTVRRDIEELVKRGSVKKVYGGVMSTAAESTQKLLPYEQRTTSLQREKDAICAVAAEFVNDGDIIYLDTGTTCLPMVEHLSSRTCTILTNSLQVCIKAIPYPNLQVISLPGTLKRETLSFVGSDIVEYLNTFNIQKAFMASTGVSLENGLTNASMEEYYIKKAVIKNSHTRLLLSDHTKFGRVSLMTYSSLLDIQHIITDAEPEQPYRTFCTENKIALHIAE